MDKEDEIKKLEEKLEEIRRAKKDVEESFSHSPDIRRQILLNLYAQEKFLQRDAPDEFYAGRAAVSDEETATTMYELAPLIRKLLAAHRPEAVVFGLFAAGLDLCTRMAQDAGYVHPEQHGGYLAEQILAHLRIGAGDLFMKPPPDASQREPAPQP